MKRIIPACISVGLLALLLWQVDRAALARNFRQTDWLWFGGAMLMFIPQIAAIAWRWKRLTAPFTNLPLPESIRLVLASASLNLVLPSKMGDLAKGFFLGRSGAMPMPRALGIVLFEKMLDVAALALLMLIGCLAMAAAATAGASAAALHAPAAAIWLAGLLAAAAIAAVALLYFVPARKLPGYASLEKFLKKRPGLIKLRTLLLTARDTVGIMRSKGSRRGEIIAWSLIIWLLHLAQIYMFFQSLNASPGFAEFSSMAPFAIFIGLLPVSIAGFGTRDAALVALFPGFPSYQMLAIAFYISLRYIIPAAAGLPFAGRYLGQMKEKK